MESNYFIVSVTGINPYVTLIQLDAFFKQITPNVHFIATEDAFDGTQKAKVYCYTKLIFSINMAETVFFPDCVAGKRIKYNYYVTVPNI